MSTAKILDVEVAADETPASMRSELECGSAVKHPVVVERKQITGLERDADLVCRIVDERRPGRQGGEKRRSLDGIVQEGRTHEVWGPTDLVVTTVRMEPDDWCSADQFDVVTHKGIRELDCGQEFPSLGDS